MSIAQRLHIGTDMCVWTVGNRVEPGAVVDPLPEGTWTVDERIPGVDALVVGTDHREELLDLADDVVPLIGSIPMVWVIFPLHNSDLDANFIDQIVEEYGWQIDRSATLDDTWQAVHLTQP